MATETTATIRKCGSRWCLYSKSEGKLLGKHETKEKAMSQERAIKARQARGAALLTALDEAAEALESRGATELAAAVDAHTGELLTQRREVLDDSGFDDVMTRDPDVAEELFDNPIKPVDETDGLTTY